MIINILEFLEDSVKNFPDKVAFADEKHEITYSNLDSHAKAVGTYLLDSLDIKGNRPIVVITEWNISTIIAFLGVLYSGNFYVPIDSKMPASRTAQIIDSVNPAAILFVGERPDFLSDFEDKIPQISFEKASNYSIDQIWLEDIRKKSVDTDPIYAIFTSGSTGIPKGVVVSHRSVINLIYWYENLFNFSSESIFGNQSPLDYTGAVNSIYSTLKTGATMHLIPRMFFSFPLLLINHLNKKQINTIIWTTSALRIIALQKALDKETPNYLEKILFTGEVMPTKVLNYFRTHLPEALYVNLYGSTETTCNCSYYIVNRAFGDEDILPIGSPFPNTNIFLLDEDNQLAKHGCAGEICIGGTSLALGYYNNQETTEKAFPANPVNDAYLERIYRTGDLGRFNELNELLFISRIDDQIKHMGYRIELGEIEAVANSIPLIDIACCLYNDKKEKIILCYQSSKANDKEILIRLKGLLPKYMLPNKLIYFESFPQKDNGKIDKIKLKEILEIN